MGGHGVLPLLASSHEEEQKKKYLMSSGEIEKIFMEEN